MIEKLSRNRVYLIGIGLSAFVAIVLWQFSVKAPGLSPFKQTVTKIQALLAQKKSGLTIVSLQVEQQSELPPVHQSLPVTDEVMILNDKGVDLVLKKQYWPGIFLFKQAMELDKGRIEPVVNMAVTLDEIGLSRPSARYLAMAEMMSPEYAPLQIIRKNLREKLQDVRSTQKMGDLHDQKHKP